MLTPYQEGMGHREALGHCSGGGEAQSEVPVELLRAGSGVPACTEAETSRFSLLGIKDKELRTEWGAQRQALARV